MIIDSIEKETQGQNDAACVYFYFQEGEKHRVSRARVWATLLTQLLLRKSGGLADDLQVKFNDSLQGSTALHSSEYLSLFKAQAATTKTVYLVIDALDSCQDAHGEKTQQGIQDDLKELLGSGIRVLFTSTGDDWFGRMISEDQKLRIKPRMQDVRTYVKKRIEDSKVLRDVLAEDQHQKDVTGEVTNMTLSSEM